MLPQSSIRLEALFSYYRDIDIVHVPLLLLLLFVAGGYVAATPNTVAFDLQTQVRIIEDDETQIVTIWLKQRLIHARSNMMLYLIRGIRMTTAMFKSASKRFLTGDPLFLIVYTNIRTAKDETVALGSKLWF